jgi:hypothetical protein
MTTSIFRRNASDSAAIRRYNNSHEDDENCNNNNNSNRDASDKSSSYGEAFFVVDMEEADEEVSHLSDPTSYMLTTPSMDGGRARIVPRNSFSAHKRQHHHGKRRLSATQFLKKPIAALVKHKYFGNSKKHQLQQQTRYQSRNHNNRVSPVEETTSRATPSSSNHQERVPLTLMVPLGNGDHTYGAFEERRNPSSSNSSPVHYQNTRRNQPSPPAAALNLCHEPTLSWEDDGLLLFDDHTATPRTLLGLETSVAQSPTSPTKSLPKTAPPVDAVEATSQTRMAKWRSFFLGGTFSSVFDRRDMAQRLLHGWEYVSLSLFVLFLMIAVLSSKERPNSSWVDVLFWAVTSFATIGPATTTAWSENEDGNGSIALMILTVLYAFLGVTTLGVVWGRYSHAMVDETLEKQTREQDILRRHVLSFFCGPPSHRGNLATVKAMSKSAVQSKSSSWKKVVSAAMGLILMMLLVASLRGDSFSQIMYYILTVATTLGESTMSTQSSTCKLLLLILFPFLVAGMLQWLKAVANYVVRNSEKKSRDDKADATELRTMLNKIQLEDGLLSRADFLEILLLSMKKVDPELLLALREGFQKATHSGSLDLTRAQLVESAVSAISEDVDE